MTKWLLFRLLELVAAGAAVWAWQHLGIGGGTLGIVVFLYIAYELR